MSVNKVNSDGSTTLIAGATLWADSPIGTILAYGGATAPAGWFICQGQELTKTDYAELYAVIGDSFGTASVNTKFVLPDLREATTKGVGLTGKSNNHYDSDGVALGEFVEDRVQSHTHKAEYIIDGVATTQMYKFATSGTDYMRFRSNTEENSSGRSGATTEVKAVGVNFIIKAKQVALPADLESAVEDAVGSLIKVKSISAKSNNYYDFYGGKIIQIGNDCFCTFSITVKQTSSDWISVATLPVNVGTAQNIGGYSSNGIELYVRGNNIECAGGTAGQIENASVWYPAET